MSLIQQVNEDLKQAMKNREEAKLRALRNIKSAFLLLQTAEGNSEVTDEACIKALQKMAKQRKDSIEIFENQGRTDLSSKEKEELSFIEAYLPEMLSEEAVKAKIQSIIAQLGANGASDMGKVMPVAMKELSGKADGKMISALVKALLS